MGEGQWKPETPSWEKLLKSDFVLKGDSKRREDNQADVKFSDLEGKYVVIYQSAHWCPPCKAFTPVFGKWYEEHAEKKNVEVIFVSCDRDAKSAKSYYDEQPWLMAPFKGECASKLSEWFPCEGIPNAQIINPDGFLVTAGAVGGFRSDEDGSAFPYSDGSMGAPCGFLGSSCPLDPINSAPCVMLYQNDASTAQCQKVIDEAFKPLAKDYPTSRKHKLAPAKVKDMFFCVETGKERYSDQIRNMANAKKTDILTYFSIPEEKWYACDAVKSVDDITADVVKAFIAECKAGKARRTK